MTDSPALPPEEGALAQIILSFMAPLSRPSLLLDALELPLLARWDAV